MRSVLHAFRLAAHKTHLFQVRGREVGPPPQLLKPLPPRRLMRHRGAEPCVEALIGDGAPPGPSTGSVWRRGAILGRLTMSPSTALTGVAARSAQGAGARSLGCPERRAERSAARSRRAGSCDGLRTVPSACAGRRRPLSEQTAACESLVAPTIALVQCCARLGSGSRRRTGGHRLAPRAIRLSAMPGFSRSHGILFPGDRSQDAYWPRWSPPSPGTRHCRGRPVCRPGRREIRLLQALGTSKEAWSVLASVAGVWMGGPTLSPAPSLPPGRPRRPAARGPTAAHLRRPGTSGRRAVRAPWARRRAPRCVTLHRR